MARIGDVEVTLHPDKAVRALASIRDKTIVWRLGDEAKILKVVYAIAQAALEEAEAHMSAPVPDHIVTVI